MLNLICNTLHLILNKYYYSHSCYVLYKSMIINYIGCIILQNNINIYIALFLGYLC